MGKTHRKKGAGAAKGPVPQLRSRNTRSSKGRLISEPESSTSQLTSQLSLLGLYAAPTIGDGNCLFRALSDQLYGSPSRHHELRQQICDHVEMHRERYEPFVEDHEGGDGDGGGGKGKGKGKSSSSTNNNSGSSALEGHVRAMRENATYGGHMELSAFADMTRRNVKVIQPGLVYVIERNLGWDEAPSDTKNTSRRSSRKPVKGPPVSASPSSSTSPGSKGKSKREGEESKVKLGKGYYVYEQVTSDEEDEQSVAQQGPTIYVAYHDWEHFSSIRNLRGPHTGLPNVVETPPPPDYVAGGAADVDSPSAAAGEAEKEGKKKKKNESGTPLKVKLKLPTSSPSPPAPTQRQQQQEDPSLIPLPTSRSASPYPPPSGHGNNISIALPPSSLSVEVYPKDPSSPMQTEMQVVSSPTSQSQQQQQQQVIPLAHTETQTQSQGQVQVPHHHPHHHQHEHLRTPRMHYRSSPKRTFDESSASGEDVASGVEAGGGPSSQKRRRRRGGSGVWDGDHHGTGISIRHNDDIIDNNNNNNRDNEGSGGGGGGGAGVGGGVPDIVMRVVEGDDPEDGADTPSLSLSASSSSSSSLSSASVSEVCSDLDEDADDGDRTAKLPAAAAAPLIVPAVAAAAAVAHPTSPVSVDATPEGLAHRAKQKYIHQRQSHAGGGAKSLTRRQRKALGLPKHFGTIARSGAQLPLASSAGAAGVIVSAGKIVIPGGKWKGRASMPSISGIDVAGVGVGIGAGAGGVAVGGGAGAGGQDVNRNRSEDSQEWRKNGTGRVDVRGFRELKI